MDLPNSDGMNRLLLIFGILLILIALVGADLRRKKADPPIAEKRCHGYTIIEFGKGVTCNGDTIRLMPAPGGGQQIAAVE